MANVIQSSAKDPVAVLELFIKQLDVFIKNSIVNINKMKAKHAQMANSWKGEQYDKFSAVLMKSIQDAAKELAGLQSLRKQLVAKLEVFRKATDSRV